MTERVKLFCYCCCIQTRFSLTKVLCRCRPLQFVSTRNTFLLNPNYSWVSGSWRHFGKKPDIHQTTADGFVSPPKKLLMCKTLVTATRCLYRSLLEDWTCDKGDLTSCRVNRKWSFICVCGDKTLRLFHESVWWCSDSEQKLFPEKLWAQLMYVREEEEHPWGPGFPPECDWRLFSSLFPPQPVLLLSAPRSACFSGTERRISAPCWLCEGARSTHVYIHACMNVCECVNEAKCFECSGEVEKSMLLTITSKSGQTPSLILSLVFPSFQTFPTFPRQKLSFEIFQHHRNLYFIPLKTV